MSLPDDHADAITETLAKTQDVKLRNRWRYYIGDHPRIFMTPKLRETFRDLADSLVENYCGLAVNSRISRLEIEGWDGVNADSAQKAWDKAGFPQRQDVWYRWGLVHGVTTLLVQDDHITANPATLAYAKPDPNDWLNVAWAGKAFQEDGRWFVTLWDETHIYRYQTIDANKERQTLPGGDSFTLTEEGVTPHGYERVPAFPINPFGYQAAPLMDQIAPIQDRINKLTANKFVAAEFGAFKQRIFFTRQALDPHAVRQQPDHAIVLDPGDADGKASVQEMGATDLTNYDQAISAEVDALFTIGTLPRHMRVNPGTAPSGEAIKADEGPLVEALTDHQREYGEALIAALALLGIEAEPIWRDVEVHNDLTNAQVVSTLVSAGVPWQVAVEKFMGFSPDEINEATVLAGATQTAAMSNVAAQTAAFLSNPGITPGLTP